MPLQFYFDQHVPKVIADGLQSRGVDVLTAFEDGSSELEDDQLLERATLLKRILFSQDEDLLVLANDHQRKGKSFSGVIYLAQRRTIIGQCVEDLELIAKTLTSEEVKNTVIYLPL